MMVKNYGIYMCIKEVVMEDSGDIAYYKNKIYYSEVVGCVTDEQGDKKHIWYNPSFDKHFKPMKKVRNVLVPWN